jgi:glycosyltransferase involved in cell wall biosynthesis
MTTFIAGREQTSSTRPRLRVLFLACHLPYPTISGGRKREYELLSRIAHHVNVELCVVSKTYDEDRANAHHLEDLCHSVTVFPAEPPARRDPSLPWHVQRHRSPAMTRFVSTAMGRVDLVHLEGYYLAQHLPDVRSIPAVLVEQNVEYLLCKQRLENERGKGRQAALLDYLRSVEAETHAWRSVDHLAAVTEDDARHIRAAAGGIGVSVVPDGVEYRSAVAPHPEVKSPSIVFAANFGYQPNVDAALYLCRSIVPLVRRVVPNVTTWLVGNAPPDDVRALACEDVVVTGRVADVRPYVQAADVVACPLRIGGGVKVKILEALALSKAIVTTTIGTQGIEGRVPAVVTDDVNRFAWSVAKLLQHDEARHELERRAAGFARGLPTWDDAAAALLDLYERATRLPGSAARVQAV